MNTDNRLMSLVLLRRLIQNQWDEFKEGLGDNLEVFLDQILRGFSDERDNGFRKKMLMVIAEMARNTIDEDTGKQKWLGVIGLLNHCMSSKKAEDLICVASILEAVPNVFGCDYDQYMNDVKNTFALLFKDHSSEIRSDAFRSFVTYVIENDDDDRLIKELSPLMSHVVELCRYTCMSEDGGDDAPLQCLAELESVAPKLVNPYMRDFLEMCVTCVLNTEKDEAFRHSATEVLATICECSTAVLKKRHSQSIEFIRKLILYLSFASGLFQT
ncbi:hypothetical protein Y032_0001g430 [Ancylostoma ceylanicum]|uniref:IPO4/5-like TPR repeats domain-containing protein n=1 Tax=Ancylostoma ceylanicum TaxID=53326 RepID=A0A016W615_9BILA|nr:hypothetical protein Y032_0001g430 [Ancylostoma ceylanicum]